MRECTRRPGKRNVKQRPAMGLGPRWLIYYKDEWHERHYNIRARAQTLHNFIYVYVYLLYKCALSTLLGRSMSSSFVLNFKPPTRHAGYRFLYKSLYWFNLSYMYICIWMYIYVCEVYLTLYVYVMKYITN